MVGVLQPSLLAWAIAALLFGGVNLAWLASMWLGLIPAGFPYLDGGVTISAAGREDPVIFFFRLVLMPTAALMILFWWLVGVWTHQLSTAGQSTIFGQRWIFPVGIIAGIALSLYTVFLGTEGPAYNFLRRYGVTVFFGFTFLAQLWSAGAVSSLVRRGNLVPPRWRPDRCLSGLVLFQMVIGLASIPLAEYALDRRMWQNIIEWNFALALCAFFAVMGAIWHRRFTLRPEWRMT